MRVLLLSLLCALTIVVAGCGDSPGEQPSSDEANGATMETAGVTVTGNPGEKPAIELPGGAPPEQLVIADIVEGDGAEVPPGATVTTHYVGVSWELGGQFDSSWDRGQPLQFPLDGVIAGWTDGIPGMRVGGRRLLVIPPDQAYGAQPPTPEIAPNDTLVFVIDMVDFEQQGG